MNKLVSLTADIHRLQKYWHITNLILNSSLECVVSNSAFSWWSLCTEKYCLHALWYKNLCSSIQLHVHTCVSVCVYENVGRVYILVYGVGVKMCESVGKVCVRVWVWRCVGVKVCEGVGVKVCEGVSVKVCEGVGKVCEGWVWRCARAWMWKCVRVWGCERVVRFVRVCIYICWKASTITQPTQESRPTQKIHSSKSKVQG